MRKILISLFVITLLLVLGACGNKKDDGQSDEAGAGQSEEQSFTIDDEETVNDSEIVATVNGEDVAGDIYNVVYTQTKIQLFNYGQDVNNLETVKELALDALVDQELLRQDAKERGITVSDEEIDNEFNAIKEENEEQLNDFLKTYKLQESAFKNQISFALYHEKYVESELSATVSDEELQETYDQLKEGNEEIPDLDEIKDDLRAEMIMQKETEMLRDIVEDLKEAATIEMKI